MAGFASVVLIEPSLSHLDRAFTYSIPDGLDVGVGAHVRAPFRGKRRRGIVIETLAVSDVEKTLPLAAVLGPGLTEELVELARFTARRYLSTLGEALAAITPARTASEEAGSFGAQGTEEARAIPAALRACEHGEELWRALGSGGSFVWQPGATQSRAQEIVAMARETLARGKGVIVLVPEVRVESETTSAIEAAFGEACAYLGADRPARARYRDWLALRAGTKRIALGGRATVFAPLHDLGLIVIDDEAHASYKEGRAPRFHARTIAAERARTTNATLVLVGVPPSVEARVAARRAPFTFISAPRGEQRRARSPVTVVDARQSSLVPAAPSLALIKETLAAGKRAVVIVHRTGDQFDRIAERTFRIAKAQRPATLAAGAGDSGAHAKALRAADCIVATPFIAKDVWIENVGALVIVDADAALSQPEFRAAEEAFATWWRALRWAGDARIAIETADPSHPAITALVRWDPDVLARAEASKRRELRYPPFASLARIDVPRARAEEVAAELSETGCDVLGPVEHDDTAVVILRATRRDDLLRALEPFATRWRSAEEPMRVDVDPWEVFVPKWRS